MLIRRDLHITGRAYQRRFFCFGPPLSLKCSAGIMYGVKANYYEDVGEWIWEWVIGDYLIVIV